MAPFWATYVNYGRLFIPTSGHTDCFTELSDNCQVLKRQKEREKEIGNGPFLKNVQSSQKLCETIFEEFEIFFGENQIRD